MSPKDGNPLCCVRAPKTDLGCYYHLVVIGAYCRKSILKQNKTKQNTPEQNRNFQDLTPNPAPRQK